MPTPDQRAVMCWFRLRITARLSHPSYVECYGCHNTTFVIGSLDIRTSADV